MIDTFAAVGEMLSWIGLGVGLPMLVIAGMIALAEGRWERAEIAVVARADSAVLRWFAGGDFHERPARAREQVTEGWHQGFVNARDPDNVRLHQPVLRRGFLALGTVFTVLGAIGFIVSFIPAFV